MPTGCPSSLAANNLTGGIGYFPARSRDRQKRKDFRRPTKVCHKRSIPAGLFAAQVNSVARQEPKNSCLPAFRWSAWRHSHSEPLGLIAEFSRSTVTRRHEAGCFVAVTGEEEAGLANSALRGAERELPRIGRPSPGTKTARGPSRFIREHNKMAGLISMEFRGLGCHWRLASANFPFLGRERRGALLVAFMIKSF